MKSYTLRLDTFTLNVNVLFQVRAADRGGQRSFLVVLFRLICQVYYPIVGSFRVLLSPFFRCRLFSYDPLPSFS